MTLQHLYPAEVTVTSMKSSHKNANFKFLGRQRGFSMVELLTAVTISMILAVVAIPQLMRAVYTSRIRGTAADLAGLIQRARIMAEQQNATLAIYTGTVDGGLQGAFINCYRSGTNDVCPAGTTWQSGVGEPDIPFSSGVSLGTAGSAPSTLSLTPTPETAGTILYFSPRGLPVKSSGATYVASKGVVFYLTDTHNNWAAVSVSGAGRSKVWVYAGGWH